MQRVSLIKMHKDIQKLKKTVSILSKKIKFNEKSIDIKRIDEDSLTPSEKRRLKKIRADIDNGNWKNFITLEQLKKKYGL